MDADSDTAARAYERLAGSAALAAGAGGIVYSVAFLGGVVAGLAPTLGLGVASAALMVGGLLTTTVMVALYRRLLGRAPAAALVGLLLSVVGAIGALTHGGYDLANVINAPAGDPLAEAGLPNPIDPRGLLTFGASGLGVLIVAWQSRRVGALPSRLALLGVLLGILLITVYLGRLIVLSPTHPLVAIPAAATGLLVSPIFYVWLGAHLRRG